jgi:hypothetical protein
VTRNMRLSLGYCGAGINDCELASTETAVQIREAAEVGSDSGSGGSTLATGASASCSTMPRARSRFCGYYREAEHTATDRGVRSVQRDSRDAAIGPLAPRFSLIRSSVPTTTATRQRSPPCQFPLRPAPLTHLWDRHTVRPVNQPITVAARHDLAEGCTRGTTSTHSPASALQVGVSARARIQSVATVNYRKACAATRSRSRCRTARGRIHHQSIPLVPGTPRRTDRSGSPATRHSPTRRRHPRADRRVYP